MPAQMIDKGIPAPGRLSQVAVAKHDDHLPLYPQEEICDSDQACNALAHGAVDRSLRRTPQPTG